MFSSCMLSSTRYSGNLEFMLQDPRHGVSEQKLESLPLHPNSELQMVFGMESRVFDFQFSALTISWPLFITLLKMRHLIKCAQILILHLIGYKPRNACRLYCAPLCYLLHHTLLFMWSHNCMLHYECFCWKFRHSQSRSTAGCSLQSDKQTRLLTFLLTFLVKLCNTGTLWQCRKWITELCFPTRVYYFI